MSRLTEKFYHNGFEYMATALGGNNPYAIDKLGKLEDLEEELDVDLIEFLSELIYVLDNSNQTTGYTSKGKEITTDYGYVESFIEDLKAAIKDKSE